MFDGADAIATDGPALDIYDTLGIAADSADILVLLQDDAVAFDHDGHRVLDMNAQGPAEFHRNDDTSQIVDSSNDACVAHDAPRLI